MRRIGRKSANIGGMFGADVHIPHYINRGSIMTKHELMSLKPGDLVHYSDAALYWPLAVFGRWSPAGRYFIYIKNEESRYTKELSCPGEAVSSYGRKYNTFTFYDIQQANFICVSSLLSNIWEVLTHARA